MYQNQHTSNNLEHPKTEISPQIQTVAEILYKKVEHIKEIESEALYEKIPARAGRRVFPLNWRNPTLNIMNRGKAPFTFLFQTLTAIRGKSNEHYKRKAIDYHASLGYDRFSINSVRGLII